MDLTKGSQTPFMKTWTTKCTKPGQHSSPPVVRGMVSHTVPQGTWSTSARSPPAGTRAGTASTQQQQQHRSPVGDRVRSIQYALNLTNGWTDFISLAAHKPRQNGFCPEISLAEACVKSGQFVLHLTNRWVNFISLSAHKPRQIRFCPEIPLVGACVKSVQYTLNLTNGGTNFISLQAPSEQVLPRNLLSRGLCKISPSCITSSKRMNKFYSTIGPQTPSEPVLTRNPLSGGVCKISSAYAKSYKRRNKFYFTTSPVWTSFAQKSPYQGLV